MGRFGEILEVQSRGEGICQCGAVVYPSTKVEIWASRFQKREEQKIISCPNCKRPGTLLEERHWLLNRQMKAFTDRSGFLVPQTWLEEALQVNSQKIYEVLWNLLKHLPNCEECGSRATHHVRHGQFLCEEHAQGYSMAQRVDWYDELKALGTRF